MVVISSHRNNAATVSPTIYPRLIGSSALRRATDSRWRAAMKGHLLLVEKAGYAREP